MGAIAVYIYSLKNRPYTVKIIMKESTHTNRPPIKVTAHNGIDSKNPQSSIAVIMSAGRTVGDGVPKPAADMILEMIPCTMDSSAIINSKPWVISPFARAKRTKTFSAASGRFRSAKLPQVFTTPITKNSTSSA